MHIWENKDFKQVLDKARKRTKKMRAEDDMDTIYLLEKEIDEYRKKIYLLSESYRNQFFKSKKLDKIASDSKFEVKVKANTVYIYNQGPIDNIKSLGE